MYEKKRRPGLLAAVAALLFLTVAPDGPALAGDANSGFYFAGKGGPTLSWINDIDSGTGRALRDDSGVNLIGDFGMAGGYAWARQGIPLRTEIELMNRTEVSYNTSPAFAGPSPNDAIATDLQNVTLMARGYYHFRPWNERWSPFVSAGLGVSRTQITGQYSPAGSQPLEVDETGYDLAWSVGGGASFYLGNNVVNDVELSYVDLGDADWGLPPGRNLRSDSYGALQLIFAIRVNF